VSSFGQKQTLTELKEQHIMMYVHPSQLSQAFQEAIDEIFHVVYRRLDATSFCLFVLIFFGNCIALYLSVDMTMKSWLSFEI
jgi:hypothetical protein